MTRNQRIRFPRRGIGGPGTTSTGPGLMPDVARRLLGEPTRASARAWRYGKKGSLKINLVGRGPGRILKRARAAASGPWFNGKQTDRPGAVEGLIRQGFLPKKAPRRPQNQRTPLPLPLVYSKPPQPRGGAHGPTDSSIQAQRLAAASVSAEGTPARAYLMRRRVWPAVGFGPARIRAMDHGPGACGRVALV